MSAEVVVFPQTMAKGAHITVNGAPAAKGKWGKKLVPLDGGGELEVRLSQGFGGLELSYGKEKIPIGPRVPVALGILAFLPIGLVAVGGAIGGGIGGLGAAMNLQIANSPRSIPLKAVMMLGTLVISAVG